jgi:hypothetical protein
MERKIQLKETYLNIDFGNSPFLKLENGLKIPYSYHLHLPISLPMVQIGIISLPLVR